MDHVRAECSSIIPHKDFSILTFRNNKFPLVKRHIPNIITSFNLVSGCIATIFAVDGELLYALCFMLLGLLFDFFDGFTARLLGVSSPIGKELDSLADVITFGLVPSMMLFMTLQTYLPIIYEEYPDAMLYIVSILPFAIAAFSAVRLAKFNLDTRQSHSFIGLPTPANALFWAGLTNFLYRRPIHYYLVPVTIGTLILLIALSCWIMVSEVPMFALKFKDFTWKDNKVRYCFMILAAGVVTAGVGLQIYDLALSLLIVLYSLISLLVRNK
mgnify:FL=1